MWRSTKTRNRSVLAAVVLASFVAAPAAHAAAVTIERWEWADQGVITDCEGVTVLWQGQASESLTFGPRGKTKLDYFKFQSNGSVAYTNAATGLTMTVNWNFIDKDLKVVDNGDGTLTITAMAAGNTQLRGPSGELLRRDPGMNRYQILIDHNGTPGDPDDDEFLEFLGVIKGSTGLNEFEGADFCEDIHSFLG